MIWAHVPNTKTFKKHADNGRGTFPLKFEANGSITEVGNFFKTHGWFMWAAWGVLGLLQISSMRYLKKYWKINVWIHRIAGSIILLITLILGFLGIRQLSWKVVDFVHCYLGIIALALSVLIYLGGLFGKIMLEKRTWSTKQLLRIRQGHRVSISLLNEAIIRFWD